MTFQFVPIKEIRAEEGNEALFEPETKEEIELCGILDSAESQELREIADILGVMYQDDCQAEKLRFYPAEEQNEINFSGLIDRIEANDPQLENVTLNNVKQFHSNQWKRLFKALEEVNTNLKILSVSNCNLKDFEAEFISEALSKNSTLKSLTLDSNLFTSKSIISILKAISASKSLEEIRINNQVLRSIRFARFFKIDFFQQFCKRLGHQMEMEIVEIIDDCPQLLRLGLTLEFRAPLNKLARILQRNLSNHKQK